MKIKGKAIIGMLSAIAVMASAFSIGFSSWTFNASASNGTHANALIGDGWGFEEEIHLGAGENNGVFTDASGNVLNPDKNTVTIRNDADEGGYIVSKVNMNNKDFEKGGITWTLPSYYSVDGKTNIPVIGIGSGSKVFSPDWAGSRLTGIVIPSTYKSIGSNAFDVGWNSGIKTITFEDGNTPLKIGHRSFYEQHQLQSLILPSRLVSMGTGAFGECTSLESLDMSKTQLTTISESCFSGSKLSSISWPSKLVSIEDYAFSTNYSGKLVLTNFPSTLVSVGKNAFATNQQMTVADFSGSSLKSLGEGAFQFCYQLKTIILPSTLTSIGKDCFNGVNGNSLTFLGSKSQWNAISKADGWNGYSIKNVVCLDGTISY
jgi:hypothetical protein